jgi:hypothetical protein
VEVTPTNYSAKKNRPEGPLFISPVSQHSRVSRKSPGVDSKRSNSDKDDSEESDEEEKEDQEEEEDRRNSRKQPLRRFSARVNPPASESDSDAVNRESNDDCYVKRNVIYKHSGRHAIWPNSTERGICNVRFYTYFSDSYD